MTPSPVQIMGACRLFSSVQGEGLQRLRDMAVLRSYSQNEMIFRQGDPCPGVFIVGSGLVRIFKTAPSGKEHVLHLVGPGGTFAEVAAIGGFDVPAFAEAVEATTCALLPSEPFAKALREDHDTCLQLLLGLSVWVKHLIGQVEDITLRDALGRVARYLLNVADPATGQVQLPSLKRHLASQLHLTSETLSRTLRRLSDLELIRSDNDQLQVIDAPQLKEIAEGAAGF